jgi:hypothetical protein
MFVIQQRARCPTSRPMHRIRMERPAHQRSRQWANGGPTARLPKWHATEMRSPQRMGPPPKFDAPLGCGNSRATRHSLFL